MMLHIMLYSMSYAFIRRSECFNYYILHEVPPIPAANTLSAKLRAGVYCMCTVTNLASAPGALSWQLCKSGRGALTRVGGAYYILLFFGEGGA